MEELYFHFSEKEKKFQENLDLLNQNYQEFAKEG